VDRVGAVDRSGSAPGDLMVAVGVVVVFGIILCHEVAFGYEMVV